MLDKPKHGWTHVRFKNYITLRASYLTDVPKEFLDMFLYYYKYGIYSKAFCDAEGFEFEVAIKDNKTLELAVTPSNKEYKFYIENDMRCPDKMLYELKYSEGIKSIAEELIDDIQNNIDDWNQWAGEVPIDLEHTDYMKLIKELQLYMR